MIYNPSAASQTQPSTTYSTKTTNLSCFHHGLPDFFRNFLRSWTYEVFWPRHVTSAETPREIVKVSNLQSSFIQNPCFISCIPVGSSWYSLVHKGSLLRVAYDLRPVVVLLLEFLKLCNSCGAGRISRECLSRYTNVSIILAPLQFLTNGIRKKKRLAHRKILDTSFCLHFFTISPFHQTLGVRCGVFQKSNNKNLWKNLPPLGSPTMS